MPSSASPSTTNLSHRYLLKPRSFWSGVFVIVSPSRSYPPLSRSGLRALSVAGQVGCSCLSVAGQSGCPSLLVAGQSGTGDPRLPFRKRPIASQAPPSRGWHVASCRPSPLLPASSAYRAACRAARAVSLCSTPPFTPFAGAHIRSGPPSYDAEGGTGSGHPATSALTGHVRGAG